MDFKSMFLVNMVNKLRLLFIAFTSTIAWLVLARGCSGDLHYDRPRNLGWRTKWSYVNELGWCKLLHGYFLVPQVVMHLQVIETSSLLSIILFIISSIETFSVDNSIFQNWKLRTATPLFLALWYRTLKKLDCSLIWNFYRMYLSIHSSNCAKWKNKSC